MPPHTSAPLTRLTDPGAAPWAPLPFGDVPTFDAERLMREWARLHAGQGVRAPAPGPLAEGWAHYHSGAFERAAAIGLAHGSAGLALANQATAVYASYLEPREATRLALLRQVAERARAQCEREHDNCQALYWQAYALAHYAQGISVARALAQGLGSRVKAALEQLIALQPRHADAHVALAGFHAEVIDKVGPLVARMTYGASAEEAEQLFERGLSLHPHSAANLMEYARGLLMLHGEARLAEATRLYQQAADLPAADARERLDQARARAGLAE